MATTQRQRPAHAKKKAPAHKAAAKKAPAAKKTTTTRRAPARKAAARPSATQAATATLRTLAPTKVLDKPAAELIGLGAIVVGVIAGLGIWLDMTGPVGRLISDVALSTMGWVGYLLPLVLCGSGAALLQEKSLRRPGPIVAGYGLLVVSLCSMLHVVDGLGGSIGSLVGKPLEVVLATWGAGTVLAGLIVTAFLVVTDTSASEAIAGIQTGVAFAVRQVRRLTGHLGTVGSGAVVPEEEPKPARARTPRPMEPDDEAERRPTFSLPPDPEPIPDPEPEIEVHVPLDEDGDGPPEQLEIGLGPAAERKVWKLPPMTDLKRGKAASVDQKAVEEGGRVLERSLAAHGVETRLVGATVGPTVTRYELELGEGVKVARVLALQKDIAYAMAASDVRLLAPIPGRSAIGVEVPNRDRVLVPLGDILATEEARKAVHPLEIGLGRDINNRGVMLNLAEMPHILIAGATGAGKSSCINSLVTSILMRATPDQVRMILIDPKRVELGQYNHLPHLLTQVVVNPKKAANALAWAVAEMERRYDLLFEVGTRDITGYNAAFDRGELVAEPGEDKVYERLPFICIVVDELNDLMMVAARDVEESICRIAQMARAVGIHLVIATQRPSVDVITGVIKANVPSRLAFAVSSGTDSKVILDQPGAERLTGKGDMLLLTASSSVARRIQGAWIGEDEVRKVVAHWRRQGQAQYVQGVEGEDAAGGGNGLPGDDEDDEMLDAAMELVVRSQLGSTSMLQRKLRVGFARAGRLMDLLERKGIVGPSEGSKARAVLMTPEELDEILARREAG